MTIVHPPSTERDTNAVEHLDFSPPCEYEDITCDAPAVWAVWMKPCVCETPGVQVIYFSDRCWVYLNSSDGWCHCSDCGKNDLLSDVVIRVERI